MENIPVKNLRSNITIFLGLIPGLADDAAFVRAEDAGTFFVKSNGGDAGGHSGYLGARLK